MSSSTRRSSASTHSTPKVGAFITVDADDARRDAAYADEHPTDRPLHGVPFCVKDLIGTAGLAYDLRVGRAPATTCPTTTHPPWRGMRDAGAIVIGKVEHARVRARPPRRSPMFGPRACNPHDVTRTTGGSSGGTAAAIAAGMGAIGLGSDAGRLDSPARARGAASVASSRPTGACRAK